MSTPWLRSNAHLGATETLGEFLRLCADAGRSCPFGLEGDPEAKLATLVGRLAETPLLIDTGPQGPTELGVDGLLVTVLNTLYFPSAWSGLGAALQEYQEMADLPADTVHPPPEGLGDDPEPDAEAGETNVQDAQYASICVDGEHPDADGIAESARTARAVAPYAADRWSWAISGVCPFWPGQDEDRYAGPFDAGTEAPVLVVGTRFDPATPYRNAERVSGDLPNAGLLTLDGWGHTAAFLGVSTCVDDAVADYLVTRETRGGASVCRPDPGGVPFAAPPGG